MCARAVARAVTGSSSSTTICSTARRGSGPHRLSCDDGVLGRNEVRMRSGGAIRGQTQHLRPESGENHLRRRFALGRQEQGLVHGIEVLDHCRVGLGVLVLADAGDQVPVRYPQAEQEPARVGLVQRLHGGVRGHGVAGVAVGDARRDLHVVGRLRGASTPPERPRGTRSRESTRHRIRAPRSPPRTRGPASTAACRGPRSRCRMCPDRCSGSA